MESQENLKPTVSHWLRVETEVPRLKVGERLEFCGWSVQPHQQLIAFSVYGANQPVMANITNSIRGWDATMEEVTKYLNTKSLVPIDAPHDQ